MKFEDFQKGGRGSGDAVKYGRSDVVYVDPRGFIKFHGKLYHDIGLPTYAKIGVNGKYAAIIPTDEKDYNGYRIRANSTNKEELVKAHTLEISCKKFTDTARLAIKGRIVCYPATVVDGMILIEMGTPEIVS